MLTRSTRTIRRSSHTREAAFVPIAQPHAPRRGLGLPALTALASATGRSDEFRRHGKACDDGGKGSRQGRLLDAGLPYFIAGSRRKNQFATLLNLHYSMGHVRNVTAGILGAMASGGVWAF